jgi:transposase
MDQPLPVVLCPNAVSVLEMSSSGAPMRPIVGMTRGNQSRAVEIAELTLIDKRIKDADKELHHLATATGSSLLQRHGIGPSGAARLLGDVADISRFAGCGRFASWNGTAPLDGSGDHTRHRLARAGNRRIIRVLHIMAIEVYQGSWTGSHLRGSVHGRAASTVPPAVQG